MIKKILQNLMAVLILSVALFIVGLVIWFFMKRSGTSLKDVLFCIGAVPMAFFAIKLMGGYVGRGDFSYQFSRTVSNESSTQRVLQDAGHIKSRLTSGLNWFLAGLIILLSVYLV